MDLNLKEKQFIDKDQRINAIKSYRERTHASLAEAHKMVTDYQMSQFKLKCAVIDSDNLRIGLNRDQARALGAFLINCTEDEKSNIFQVPFYSSEIDDDPKIVNLHFEIGRY